MGTRRRVGARARGLGSALVAELPGFSPRPRFPSLGLSNGISDELQDASDADENERTKVALSSIRVR